MAHVYYDVDENAPKGPHLALLTGDGEAIPIPQGAYIYFIEDPSNAKKVLPMILEKVSIKKGLRFRCCDNPRCTRKLILTAAYTGKHYEQAAPVHSSPRDSERTAPSAPSQSTDTPTEPSSESDPENPSES